MHLPPDILDFESCPEVFSGRKITETHVLLMFELIYKDPACPTRLIREQMVQYHQVQVHVTDRHINRLRAKWGFSRHKGRPKKNPVQESDVQSQLPVVRPNLGFVGVHIFDDWLEQKGGFSEVIKLLMIAISEYRKEHPDESFSLLNHKNETLLLRFKALFYAPLFGIEKLTEYDIKEHALETVTGRGYQNSTLRQFLGHLERIDAGTNLMPALLPTESGNICYIDGHMIAFWTKTSMHKGKITMLGRIMAGSQAVVAHNDAGHALYVEYYPPDIRLPRVILEYCEWIKNSTGIELFVIDREVNSLKMAQAFEEREWGLLSMLNSNEYKALSDWDVEHIGELEDGSQVYKGKWASPRKKDDPRIFVIVETKDRLLPYWGTPKVEELLNALEWPRVYSERTEIQENSFKRMIDHGALNINFGVKKITGPDRHQERTVVTLKNKLSKNQEKIQKKKDAARMQEGKVQESEEKQHKKRLVQRERKLAEINKSLKDAKDKERQIKEKLEISGTPRQREDRDFRKQKIMTFRTLLLENALMAFIMTLLSKMDIKVGMETIISLFFKRSGTYLENASEIIYQFNTGGLSLSCKEILIEIAKRVSEMEINRWGKPIRVELREAPT